MSFTAEQSVLASILINPECLDDVREILVPSDFSEAWHAMLFETMIELADSGEPCDVITVTERLSNKGLDPELDYLGQIAHDVPAFSRVMTYAEIVKNSAQTRRLHHVGYEITKIANGQGTAEEKLNMAESLFGELDNKKSEFAESMKTIGKGHVDVLMQRTESKGQLRGLSTPWEAINDRTNGLVAPDLIIVAARPGMGKTTFALNLANHVAKTDPVLMFSCEMSKGQLYDRNLSHVGRMPLKMIKDGSIQDHPEYLNRLGPSITMMNNSQLFIDDSGGLHVSEVRRRARKHQRKHGLKLVVIDYLQLLKGEGQNRNLEVGYVSRQLKEMAKELNIPVIALAQLNRGVDARGGDGKRPVASDLRDSGEIEQDADIIAFLYRDEIYNENSADKGICEVIWRKFRDGEPGTDRLASRLDISTFDNLSPMDYAAMAISKKETFEYK